MSACLERISDVKLKGTGTDQKIFVTLERRIGAYPDETMGEKDKTAKEVNRSVQPDQIAAEQWLGDLHNCGFVERRDLVFMVPKSKQQTPEAQQEAKGSSKGDELRSKPARPAPSPGTPDFSVALTPSQSLLFRFSALTFNAHHIHLDKAYCREIEGHRNLLVHGPLSCTLMIEVLRKHIGEASPGSSIVDLTYRNTGPLYAEESLRVCVRRKDHDPIVDSSQAERQGLTPGSVQKMYETDEVFVRSGTPDVKPWQERLYAQFDCWVENNEGRTCVKGTAICLLDNAKP